MVITIFVSSISGGGAEKVACRLADFLSQRHDVRVLVITGVAESKYSLSEGVLYSALWSEGETENVILKNALRLRRLIHYIKCSETEVYLALLPAPISLLMSFRRIIKVPVIVSERCDPGSMPQKMQGQQLKAFKKADGAVFQLEGARDWYNERCDLPRSTVIPNAVDAGLHNKPPFTGEREKVIVSAGRLSEQKNFEMLIRAFGGISGSFTDYSLEIYGEGTLRPKLEALISELSLNGRVSLPGFCPNLSEKISRAALFVLPSNYEGMPNALMEAMSLGVPCAATNCPAGGSGFLIKHGVNGFLVPVGDEAALTAAIEEVLSDKALSERLGVEAFKLRETLEPGRIYGEWERFIAETAQVN